MRTDVHALAAKLPPVCASTLPATGEPILIRFGVKGFYPQSMDFDCETFNRTHKITPLQVEAMENGSMFGWECPGADPDYLRKIYADLAERIATGTDRRQPDTTSLKLADPAE
jgi:hypothetical protein